LTIQINYFLTFLLLLLLSACSQQIYPDVKIEEKNLAIFYPSTFPKPLSVSLLPITKEDIYQNAYLELKSILNGHSQLDFKRAVFLTENAWYNGTINYDTFNENIEELAMICRLWQQSQEFKYTATDKEKVLTNASIFAVMCDTIWLTEKLARLPYQYNFDDYNGNKDWTSMFVTALLETHRGNCHSMPFLYKILAEELGAPAWLSFAPNHLYIKCYSKPNGWYNTELTSGIFPQDAWIMASGYVSQQSIVSGIYMDTLSLKQSIVICLVDLAQGYQRKTGRNAFVLKCADLALEYYPNYANALILKAETLKRQLLELNTNDIVYKVKYEDMRQTYMKAVELGYRNVPEDVYKQWLFSILGKDVSN
jgi:hypothetical protein